MDTRAWLMCGAVLAVLVAGCDSGSSSSDSSPGPDGTTAQAVDPDYWFDDSPVVARTEPHTTETVAALELDEPTVAAAMEQSDMCWESVRVYVGINPDNWVP